MTAKKVLRPYTREEVLATLGAKVSTVAPTARSFSPGGLSASSVFANRRAAITKGGEGTSESAPAGRAKSAAVFTSNFAARVFSARRGRNTSACLAGAAAKPPLLPTPVNNVSHAATAGCGPVSEFASTDGGLATSSQPDPASPIIQEVAAEIAGSLTNAIAHALTPSGGELGSAGEASRSGAGGSTRDVLAVKESYLGSSMRARGWE